MTKFFYLLSYLISYISGFAVIGTIASIGLIDDVKMIMFFGIAIITFAISFALKGSLEDKVYKV